MSHKSPCPTCGCVLYREHGTCAGSELLHALKHVLMAAGEGSKLGRAIDLLPRKVISNAELAILKAEGRS